MNDSLDAIDQSSLGKVEEQPDFLARCGQIRQHLGEMHIVESLNRFSSTNGDFPWLTHSCHSENSFRFANAGHRQKRHPNFPVTSSTGAIQGFVIQRPLSSRNLPCFFARPFTIDQSVAFWPPDHKTGPLLKEALQPRPPRESTVEDMEHFIAPSLTAFGQ